LDGNHLPDDLYEALRAERRAQFSDDNVAGYVQDLARRALAEAAAPGFERDGLTGLRSIHRLRMNISKALAGSSGTEAPRYRERFHCNDPFWIKR